MNHDFAQLGWNEQLDDDCRQIVRLAVREDLDRFCDWTTLSLVPDGSRASAYIVAREVGVISGLIAAKTAIDEMEADILIEPKREDGEQIAPQDVVAKLSGSSRDILTTERILLNLIGRLSGIASLTRSFVDLVQHTQAHIYDTRKTTPGWRRMEKYAVRTGGGKNHRLGLFAAVMIKDNHLALSEDHGMTAAVAVARSKDFVERAAKEHRELAGMIFEVEVDSMDQLKEVLQAGPDIVLLDNMSPQQLIDCVHYRDEHAPDVELEASGGVDLKSVVAIAETGVERISVGALTHSATNFDVGLDWI